MNKENVVCMYIHAYTHTHTHTHTHTEEYYTAIKKYEIMRSETTQMDPKDIMLREINQTEKDKYHMTPLISGV